MEQYISWKVCKHYDFTYYSILKVSCVYFIDTPIFLFLQYLIFPSIALKIQKFVAEPPLAHVYCSKLERKYKNM